MAKGVEEGVNVKRLPALEKVKAAYLTPLKKYRERNKELKFPAPQKSFPEGIPKASP